MKTVEGRTLSDKDLGILLPAEIASFAVRPSYVTVGQGAHWGTPLVLVTDKRFIVSKDRIVGKRKADFEVEWSGVDTIKFTGNGAQIHFMVTTSRGDVELFVQPEFANDVEMAILSRISK